MDKTQTTLLLALAKKLEKNKSSKETAIKTLSSAGIITKNGKITRVFPNLNRIVSVSK